MPNDIEQTINTCLAQMRAHPDRWLLPIHRRELYDVLDPIKSGTVHSQIRPWLELETARSVLRYWPPIAEDPVKVWVDELDVPAQMISLTEELLRGTAAIGSANKLANHWGEVDGLTGELPNSQYYRAWCVYRATHSALYYVLGHDEFIQQDWTYADIQIDNSYGDTANWAVIAFAGGQWIPDYSSEKYYDRFVGDWNYDLDEVRERRRQFWEWWLLEAIPTARKQAAQYSA